MWITHICVFHDKIFCSCSHPFVYHISFLSPHIYALHISAMEKIKGPLLMVVKDWQSESGLSSCGLNLTRDNSYLVSLGLHKHHYTLLHMQSYFSIFTIILSYMDYYTPHTTVPYYILYFPFYFSRSKHTKRTKFVLSYIAVDREQIHLNIYF